MFDNREPVRDEQVSELELFLKLLEKIHNLRLHRNVERRDRLIRNDQFRVERESSRDADALALPAGEFVRVTIHVIRIKSDATQKLGNTIAPLALRSLRCE